MTGIASLFGLALAVSVVFAIWRISGNVRAIRERLDFFVPAQRAVWKHQGMLIGDKADISAASSSAPPTTQAVAENRKPALHEREDAASRAYRAAHPNE